MSAAGPGAVEPVTIPPVAVPGGNPVIALPGVTPTKPPADPEITEEPVFVTVLAPKTPKLCAEPRSTLVAALETEGRMAIFTPIRSATVSAESLKFRFILSLFHFQCAGADLR
jgi:hypothetical protein